MYILYAYIGIPCGEYETLKEALQEKEHLEFLQPENYYEIKEAKEALAEVEDDCSS